MRTTDHHPEYYLLAHRMERLRLHINSNLPNVVADDVWNILREVCRQAYLKGHSDGWDASIQADLDCDGNDHGS